MKTTKYKVTKDVPLPTSGRSFGSFCPFSEMEVGDAFEFSTIDEKRVIALAEAYGKKNGAAFLVNVGDRAYCWRTS